jgi:hypothetical protein
VFLKRGIEFIFSLPFFAVAPAIIQMEPNAGDNVSALYSLPVD